MVGEAGDREALEPSAAARLRPPPARREAEQLAQELDRRDRPPRQPAGQPADRPRLAEQHLVAPVPARLQPRDPGARQRPVDDRRGRHQPAAPALVLRRQPARLVRLVEQRPARHPRQHAAALVLVRIRRPSSAAPARSRTPGTPSGPACRSPSGACSATPRPGSASRGRGSAPARGRASRARGRHRDPTPPVGTPADRRAFEGRRPGATRAHSTSERTESAPSASMSSSAVAATPGPLSSSWCSSSKIDSWSCEAAAGAAAARHSRTVDQRKTRRVAQATAS